MWAHAEWLLTSQEDRSHQKPILLAFWSWTVSFEIYEKINICCLSHSAYGLLLWQPKQSKTLSFTMLNLQQSPLVCLPWFFQLHLLRNFVTNLSPMGACSNLLKPPADRDHFNLSKRLFDKPFITVTCFKKVSSSEKVNRFSASSSTKSSFYST